MINRIKQFLNLPVLPVSPEIYQLAKILNGILIAVFGGITIIFVWYIYAGRLDVAGGLLAVLVSLLFSLWLLRKSKVVFSIRFIFIMLTGLALYLPLISDGTHDSALMIFPGLIITASLFVDNRSFIGYTCLILAVISLLFLLEVRGVVKTPYSQQVSFVNFLEISIIILLTAFTAGLLAHNLKENLAAAQKSEQTIRVYVKVMEKQNEDLIRSESRWRSLVENAPDNILIISQDGVVKFINARLNTAPYSGRNIFEFIPVEYHRVIQETIEQALQTGQVAQCEIERERANGERRWLSVRTSPIYIDEQNYQFMVIATDITEIKQATQKIHNLNILLERRVLERTAELENANQELESFAYSIAHELRAPLRAMDGYSSLLLEDYFDQFDETGKHYLKSISQNSQAMTNLIKDLLELAYVSRAEMHPTMVNLSQLAENILQKLTNKQPERHVKFSIAADIRVFGDFHLLNQVMLQLLDNAWKFTQDCPETHIEFNTI